MKFKSTPNADVNETHLMGDVMASFKTLKTLFGEPSEGDGYKVSTEWIVSSPVGETLTIYDWKTTSLYDGDPPTVDAFRKLPEYQWHIGGKDAGAALALITYINKASK